jgi:hypothetical protein
MMFSIATWEGMFFQAIDQHAQTKQKRIAKSKWINGDILNQLKVRDNLLEKLENLKLIQPMHGNNTVSQEI